MAEETFVVQLEDGRVALCEKIVSQPYQDCESHAGLVENLEPDTIYLGIERDEETGAVFFLRPDEAMAIVWILSGALWSARMKEDEEGTDD
ncbi:MAG: hypothetical protein KAY24_00020 [Candidatus Eisenbacteria sp.]|nr:hypothetical protein [Candidatus Eisenbacteria bacterium]